MRVAAAVALLAGVVAVAAARAPGTAPAGQLQFAPAPGWTEVAQGGSVIAATVPIEDSPQTAHADLTVHDLPTDAVVITASIRRPEHETYSDAAFPERSLPLSLADADVRHSFEAQPNPEVPEYVPWQRVNESASVLTALGAEVLLRRYPGLPHTINQEEIAEARRLIARAFSPTVNAAQ